ncbi:MAG: PorT family protein [Taibaiella sp.]|nr:PorT family protein [Taibaiella sp.]
MKTRNSHLLLASALMLVTVTGICQETDFLDQPVRVFEGRLVGGMNISQVDGDTYAGYHKVGINAGAMVFVNLPGKWAISLEMLYAAKGARGAHVSESYYVGTYFDKYYLNLNYAEIPIAIHYKQFPFLDFEAGISYGRLISSKEWGVADVPVVIDPVYNYFNSSEIAGLGGANMRIGKKMYANLRFQYSLTAIRPYPRIPQHYFVYPENQVNNVVTLRLMYVL